jgi:hypothetical protein
MINRKKLLLSVIAIILGIVVLAPMVSAAKNTNPNVLPVNSVYAGKSYADWSEEWWKWAFSIPASSNPLTDTTGEFCAEGQSGHVWFIGGILSTQPSPVQVTRTCTIPAGKALFFPIVNGEGSVIEGDGSTEDELRTVAEGYMKAVTFKEVIIDGKNLNNLDNYKAESDLFTFKLPENNVLNKPVGSDGFAYSESVSDGYWIMLTPLSAGQHTIHIHAKIVFDPNDPKAQFETEVTYILTVK